jgi:hypothetical protein
VGGQASEVDAAPGSVAVLGLDESEVIDARAGRRIVGFRAAGSARVDVRADGVRHGLAEALPW